MTDKTDDTVFREALTVVLRDLLSGAREQGVDCAMEAVTLGSGDTELEAVMLIGYGSAATALVSMGKGFLASRGELKSLFEIAKRARAEKADLEEKARGVFDGPGKGRVDADGLQALRDALGSLDVPPRQDASS